MSTRKHPSSTQLGVFPIPIFRSALYNETMTLDGAAICELNSL
jgi:hypothetical protein